MKNFIETIANNIHAQFNTVQVLAGGLDNLLVSSTAPFGDYPQSWNEGISSFRAKINTYKEHEYPSTT